MDAIDISEVVRRTGLTSRALRFYEARGLVRPLRTDGGRRWFGPGEMARLNAVTALKRAGFPLSAIARMLEGKAVDLGTLVEAQLAETEARAAEIAEARRLLLNVQSRIDRGEPIDVATLCSLIRQGNVTMESENWKRITDRYITAEEKPEWAAGMEKTPGDFDQAAYGRISLDRSLRRNVVFADHSLVSDAVFAEMHLISCRNVLIYFDRTLQDRAIGLFRDSLVHRGFLGLGAKESLRFSSHAGDFSEFSRAEKIYQKGR